MAIQLIKFPAVQARVPLCKKAIYQRIREGRFPGPIALGGRAVAWDAEEVDRWVEERKAQRDSLQATLQVGKSTQEARATNARAACEPRRSGAAHTAEESNERSAPHD